ncbi:hypothetical protein [Bacillus weihaiensis]|uniref:hypothetical protein n=1 Tax=Bacillus weihaiensis TaxID=1547283 RepID=UPI002354C6DA|nr:hypothetical protein [Bacillus weihaiensis]
MAKGKNKKKRQVVINNPKVQNTVPSKKNVQNNNSPDKLGNNTLVFDFTYKSWLKSIGDKQFVNKLSDAGDFAQFTFEILYKVFPEVQSNWSIIRQQPGKVFKHCHPVAKEKLNLVKSIAQSIHGRTLLDNDEDYSETLSYWQLGTTQSVRVITIYDSTKNVMYPMFVDYHHLIHPSVKHNQTDHKHNKFCPYCRYERGLAFEA